MLDARTKRTFIKNSPVTTQTPSWILFSFDIERTKNSIDRSSFRGFIRSYVHHYYTSFLRTSRRTNFSPLFVRQISDQPHRDFGSHLYSSNHRFGISSFTIFYAETSLHRISLQGIDWILISTSTPSQQRTTRKDLSDISTNNRKRLATALFE